MEMNFTGPRKNRPKRRRRGRPCAGRSCTGPREPQALQAPAAAEGTGLKTGSGGKSACETVRRPGRHPYPAESRLTALLSPPPEAGDLASGEIKSARLQNRGQ